jgi:hypothetical protein
MCFIVHKTISELEHAILTTLFFSVQKTPIGVNHTNTFPHYDSHG